MRIEQAAHPLHDVQVIVVSAELRQGREPQQIKVIATQVGNTEFLTVHLSERAASLQCQPTIESAAEKTKRILHYELSLGYAHALGHAFQHASHTA